MSEQGPKQGGNKPVQKPVELGESIRKNDGGGRVTSNLPPPKPKNK